MPVVQHGSAHQHILDLATVRARIADDGAADGARNPAAPLQPGPSRAGQSPGQPRQRCATLYPYPQLLAAYRLFQYATRGVEDHDAADASVAYQDVAATTEDAPWQITLGGDRHGPRQLGAAPHLHRPLGRPAYPQSGPAGEEPVALAGQAARIGERWAMGGDW